jgi:uncharacterized protein YutD
MNEYTSHYIDHTLLNLHAEYHSTIELLNAYLAEYNFGMAYNTIGVLEGIQLCINEIERSKTSYQPEDNHD